MDEALLSTKVITLANIMYSNKDKHSLIKVRRKVSSQYKVVQLDTGG